MSTVDSPNIDVERPPIVKRPGGKSRVVGIALLSIWAVFGLMLVYYLINVWSLSFIEKYGVRFFQGALTTLGLVSSSLIVGAVLSLPLALGRNSKNMFISGICYAYVYFFRGTPLLAQAFLIYYGFGEFFKFFKSIGLWWFFKDAWNCGFFVFALNTAAYQAEILRGAINNVPKGQWEGAAALGIGKIYTFFRIILPQALITALRPYGNEIILMIKGSAIVAVITVYDLMGITKWIFSQTFDFQIYLWAAIVYLIIVEILRQCWDKLEEILTRHLQR